MIDQAKDAFTSSARDAGTSLLDQVKDSSFLDTIKENPMPAAAVGLSVAWFLSKMGEAESDRYRDERFRATGDPYYAPRRPSYRRYDTYGTYAGGYGERSQEGRSQDSDPSLTDKASDALDTAKSKASSALDSARDAAGDAVDAVKDTLSSSADASRDQAPS